MANPRTNNKGLIEMTAMMDTPTGMHTDLLSGQVNARREPVYLKGEGFELTARQIVYALASHLRYFGDTLDPKIVDPLAAIDAHMRFDGDMTAWATGRTPAQACVLLARAEAIARDYFGPTFPTLPW